MSKRFLINQFLVLFLLIFFDSYAGQRLTLSEFPEIFDFYEDDELNESENGEFDNRKFHDFCQETSEKTSYEQLGKSLKNFLTDFKSWPKDKQNKIKVEDNGQYSVQENFSDEKYGDLRSFMQQKVPYEYQYHFCNVIRKIHAQSKADS